MEATLGKLAREESGIALIITVLLLLMVSAIGISALNRAGEEKTVAVASRRQIINVTAAELGLRMVQSQMKTAAAKGVMPQNITVYDNAMVKDSLGRTTSVRTGAIGSATGVGTPIKYLGPAQGGEGSEAGTGHQINQRVAYRVDITTTDPAGANTQVQAQYVVVLYGSGIGGY